ncbi:MAG: hypothetical protein V3R16_08480, partial [Nitrospirales bacterium]
ALRDDQGRQNRIESVGEGILTIAASAFYAESRDRTDGEGRSWELANEVFRPARKRIDRQTRELVSNDDAVPATLGAQALRGHFASLSNGIIQRGLDEYTGAEHKKRSQS